MSKQYDLIGMRFTKLVVEEKLGNIRPNDKKIYWRCKCDCGNEKVVCSTHLLNKQTKSCGCLPGEKLSQLRSVDLIGQRFGRLVVEEKAYKDTNQHWKCLCDCGNVIYPTTGNLRSGNTKSCGCVAKERISQINKKHGLRHTRLYSIWVNMRGRCYNKNNNRYNSYGGKGIVVCDEWQGDQGFQNFYDWAIQSGYKDSLTLERMDNSKNYCPSNCKWATMKEQQNHRTNNHYVTINGITKSFKEWCDSGEYDVSYSTAKTRLTRGWKDIDAITTPARKYPIKRNK